MNPANKHIRELDAPERPIKENALNRMCASLASPENCKRFKAFPESYCHSYGLNTEETHAVTDLDIMRMLQLGGDIRRLEFLTRGCNMELMEVGAQQTGLTPDEFKSRLIAEHYINAN